MKKRNSKKIIQAVKKKIKDQNLIKIADKEGGDYWDCIKVDKELFDINLYDNDGEMWTVSVYGLEMQDGQLIVNTSDTVVEALKIKTIKRQEKHYDE